MPKPRRKPARTPPRVAAFVTLERLRHGDQLVVETDTGKAGAHHARNRTQTMLDRYRQRRQITADQHFMGEWVYKKWRAAECSELRAGTYEVLSPGSGLLSDGQANAREALNRVLKRVGRPRRAVLIHVCICDLRAGPRMQMLRDALDIAIRLTRRSIMQ